MLQLILLTTNHILQLSHIRFTLKLPNHSHKITIYKSSCVADLVDSELSLNRRNNHDDLKHDHDHAAAPYGNGGWGI